MVGGEERRKWKLVKEGGGDGRRMRDEESSII